MEIGPITVNPEYMCRRPAIGRNQFRAVHRCHVKSYPKDHHLIGHYKKIIQGKNQKGIMVGVELSGNTDGTIQHGNFIGVPCFKK